MRMSGRLILPSLATFALCGLFACSHPLSQDELRSHFATGGGPDWLFVPSGHIDFDAHTAAQIREWLTSHDTGWVPAYLKDFNPAKTQLLTDNCAVEIDGGRIVVSFERKPEDTDTTVYIQRPLSSDERLFWDHIIEQIKTPNHALQPTAKGGG